MEFSPRGTHKSQNFLRRVDSALWVCLLTAVGLVLPARGDDAPSAKSVTFAKDAAPIIFDNCAGCHRPGQIGPMSLLSYQEVRPWAKSIKKVVGDKKMPPWHADPAYGHFKNAMNLNEAQIATLVNWVDQGAPEGDRSATPPVPAFSKDNEWRLGKPDQVFTMLESYKVEDDVEDHYENVLIPSGLETDKWVTATELIPGAPDVVHHILVFIAKPGKLNSEKLRTLRDANQEGGDPDPSILAGGLFAKYAPGANPEIWPAGHGRLMPAHCDILFQIHYHKQAGAGTARTDRSRLAVKYADGPVEHPITTAWLVNPTFKLAPGANNIEARSSFKFIDDGHIYALAPHLHLRGKDFLFEATYPDGKKETLLSVPNWDFNWQMSYIFNEPKEIPKGTVIRVVAHWDNSAANPNNPDPNEEVTWGEASTDEMMIGFMDYTYVNKKQFQAQYGLPEDLHIDPFGLGGNGNQQQKMREEFREQALKRRAQKEAQRKAKLQSQPKPAPQPADEKPAQTPETKAAGAGE